MKQFLIILFLLFSFVGYSQDQTIELCDGNQTSFTYTALGTPDCIYTWKLFKENRLIQTYTTDEISITFNVPGQYQLRAQVENALCFSAEELYVISVIPCRIPAVFIPNSFTPNKDNLNDNFIVKGSHITEYEINIFTRWGDLIYKSNDITDSWDGTLNGVLSPIGVYVYLIRYKDVFGLENVKYGTITLYR